MANEAVTWTAGGGGTYKGNLGWDYWLLADAIVDAAFEMSRLRNYIRTRSIADVPSNSGRFPTLTSVGSAAALTDGTDLTTITDFSPSAVTLNVAEVGLKFVYTDLTSGGSVTDMSEIARYGGRGIVDKENADIAALFTGLSNTVGSGTADLSEANVLAGLATLRGAKEYGPYTMVIDPDSWYNELVGDIGTTIAALGNTGGTVRGESNDLLSGQENVGPLLGIANIVLSTDVDLTTDVYTGAIFNERAFGLIDKWTIRPEMERDASLRGTEVVVTSAYAVSEIVDAAGVGVTTDGPA